MDDERAGVEAVRVGRLNDFVAEIALFTNLRMKWRGSGNLSSINMPLDIHDRGGRRFKAHSWPMRSIA